jgi:peptidoglycan/LPS O-acetylase OafA/YrhL
MTPRLSSFLDAARWIAATLVVVSHVRLLFLAYKGSVQHLTAPIKALYAVANVGHEAVVVFFVISGFLVGGLSIRKIREGRFSLGEYTAARFSRIYVVLVPALIVGGLLDVIGLHWSNASGLYTTISPLGDGSLNFKGSIADHLNFPTFVGNLLMLETIVTERFGSNGPLWSLVYEWWYYVLFGAVAVALTAHRQSARIAAGALGLIGLFLLPPVIVLWGLIWVLGAAAAIYVASPLPKPPIWLGILAMTVSAGVYRHMHSVELTMGEHSWHAFLSDLSITIGFCILTMSCARAGKALPGARFHRWAADFSYSTYLVHFPFVLCVGTLTATFFGVPLAGQPTARSVAVAGAVLMLALTYAYVFSLVTEVHTPKVRTLLQRAMVRRAPKAVAVEQTGS